MRGQGLVAITGDFGSRGPDGRIDPYGWDENSRSGSRGSWCGENEEELLKHLIFWLEQCEGKHALQDPAGNIYLTVDSYVVKQTLESLRRYKRLMAEPLSQTIKNA